jgi:hypothetical protein
MFCISFVFFFMYSFICLYNFSKNYYTTNFIYYNIGDMKWEKKSYEKFILFILKSVPLK